MRVGVFFLGLLIWLFFFASCAIQVPPTGGNKDTIPPKVLKFIPENYSVNFTNTDIRITFNEFIQLKDISSQLIVSPPLKYQAEAKVRGKTLIIHLEDTLHENSTYTLNFGNAIADNTEGNAIENFQYVFSTGKEIDSLKVSGKVENAFDNRTSKGIDVMLYKTMDDSVPYKQLPNYLGKTNANGEFHINNVSEGEYKIIALRDTNSNYLFDNADELIAFNDSTVKGGQSGIHLRVFKEKQKLRLVKVSSEEPGKATIVYNQPLINSSIQFLGDTSKLQLYSKTYSTKHDTVIFWYRNLLSDSLNLVLRHESNNDTISVRLRRSDEKGKSKYTPTLNTNISTEGENMLGLNQPLQMLFNHPVEKYDVEKLKLTEDSVEIKKYSVTFKDSMKQRLEINYAWKEKAKYALFIPPATLTDIFGTKNDTLQYIFRTKQLTDYGTLALNLQLPSQKKTYLLLLIDERETIYRQTIVHTDTVIHYDFLDPRAYRLKLIEDANNNGEWDTGNYLQHIQPENVFYYKDNITVRANWDVDVKWNPEK